MSSIALRQSIRWLPDTPREPTHTVVLTGPSGVFVDVRFFKGSAEEIDWAFAGYRNEASPNVVQFKHHIDSRTTDPLSVIDAGTNTTIHPGVTLEVGEMVNPLTGKMTEYEEIWEDTTPQPVRALFVRNVAGTVWRARVNEWQLALGRDDEGVFWAFQALKGAGAPAAAGSPGDWDVVYSTRDGSTVRLLPSESEDWEKGEERQWDGDTWVVLDSEK